MEAVKYYLSTNKKWFEDFAIAISSVTGETVNVKNNRLVFPPGIAEGRFEFYELTEGLSILLVDCLYHKKLRLKRDAVPGTDYYKIFFNAGDGQLIVEKNSGRRVNTGSNMSEAILFTSNSIPVSFVTPVETRVRNVELIFNKNWAGKHISGELPNEATVVKNIVAGDAVQFTATADLNCLDLVNEMLAIKMDSPSAYLYMEGLALQLFSSIIRNVIDEQVGENFIYSGEYERIENFVKKQEEDLDVILPSLEEAAIECNIGRSKFITLFNSYYGMSYGVFFNKMRLKHAYELLRKDRSVNDAAHSVGYTNVSNFIKTFRNEFGMSPKEVRKYAVDKRVNKNNSAFVQTNNKEK